MKYQLLPVSDQVIVITGASSGIGLVTAKRAAHRGARVVLAARNENDLRGVCDDIRRDGGRASYVVADVTNPDDVKKIGETAIAEFGRIDTWLNLGGHVSGSRQAESAADRILRAAEKPGREPFAGGAARLMAVGLLAGLVTFLGLATLRGYARS